ncbi:MAG: hypothetical protein LBS09_09110 [Bacteroidales bacterium]|nr:hypothetical protein [Bacteroidales bacterium]
MKNEKNYSFLILHSSLMLRRPMEVTLPFSQQDPAVMKITSFQDNVTLLGA